MGLRECRQHQKWRFGNTISLKYDGNPKKMRNASRLKNGAKVTPAA
jgi:hypothetical protein